MKDFLIIVNEDNDHFFKLNDQSKIFYNLQSEFISEETLRDYVDYFAKGGVDVISFCVNGQRTSYRSKVMDAIWDPTFQEGTNAMDFRETAKGFYEKGLDPYVIWIEQCHKRNIKAWISLRMNENHHVAPWLFFRADRRFFTNIHWRLNPELTEILPDQDWNYYVERQIAICWNYALAEVRQLMVQLLEETMQRYDGDAYELDFMRDPFCLPIGKERENTHFMTEFIRECAAVTRKYQKKLAVRLPYHPEVAESWGFDVKTYCRENLVDIIVASSYSRSFEYEFPAEDWQAVTDGRIPVYPGVDLWIPAISQGPAEMMETTTVEFIKGWLDNMQSQGLPGGYLFNYSYCIQEGELRDKAEPENFRKFMTKGFSWESILNEERCCQMGFQDFVPPGEKETSQMPVEVPGGEEVVLLIRVGTVPESGLVKIEPKVESDADLQYSTILLNGVLPAGGNGLFRAEQLRSGWNEITFQLAPQAKKVTLFNLYCRIGV